MSEKPLIWTTKGNVPIETLKHEVEWRLLPTQIIFIERYLDGEEVVKESAHIHILEGAAALGQANI